MSFENSIFMLPVGFVLVLMPWLALAMGFMALHFGSIVVCAELLTCKAPTQWLRSSKTRRGDKGIDAISSSSAKSSQSSFAQGMV